MAHNRTDQTIALAGLYQATLLVHQIASSGKYDQDDLETCIQSIFRVDIDQAEDAYGGAQRLRNGLDTLIEQFASPRHPASTGRHPELYITRYVAGILVLERRLVKNPEMLGNVRQGIERARQQAEHFSLLHDNVLASLAHLYSETISTLRPRIMVQGEHIHLANDTNANRIRALLLAAIRAAVLWRQCGGNRWHLFLSRRAIVDEAVALRKRL